jgi:hypothetical protein
MNASDPIREIRVIRGYPLLLLRLARKDKGS